MVDELEAEVGSNSPSKRLKVSEYEEADSQGSVKTITEHSNHSGGSFTDKHSSPMKEKL